MHGRSRRDRGRRYQCAAQTLGANAENHSCLTEVLGECLDVAVLAEVLLIVDGAVATVPGLRAALEQAWKSIQRQADGGGELAGQRLHQLERQVAQARARLTQAALLFADGELDKLGYEFLRDQVTTDLEAAESQIHQLSVSRPQPVLPPLEAVVEKANGWATALHQSDVPAQREVIATLVERVVPVRVRRGQYTAEITWTPLGQALQAFCTDMMLTAA